MLSTWSGVQHWWSPLLDRALCTPPTPPFLLLSTSMHCPEPRQMTRTLAEGHLSRGSQVCCGKLFPVIYNPWVGSCGQLLLGMFQREEVDFWGTAKPLCPQQHMFNHNGYPVCSFSQRSPCPLHHLWMTWHAQDELKYLPLPLSALQYTVMSNL